MKNEQQKPDGKKTLTTFQAACIITGYGIGGGVMSMPYLAAKTGFVPALAILAVSLFASYVLHLMIARLSLKTNAQGGGQLVSCLDRFLFKGKYRKVLTASFCVLMVLILLTNLAAYITGAEEILVGLLPLPPVVCKIIFYIAAASVVLFGLKAVGISESIAVPMIFVLVLGLAAGSVPKASNSLNLFSSSFSSCLAFFSMAMFAMSAFFSVPQAVEGLEGDEKKLRKALFLGFFFNFLIILVVTLSALKASEEITEVAMVGWSKAIGIWAQVIGGLFTILAMLTTYWSLSLALSSIVGEQFSLGSRTSWLIATVPSFILALFNFAGFMDYMRIAGGLIAIVIAVMIVPAYRNAEREIGSENPLWGGRALEWCIIAAYVLMGIGSVVPV